jgi:hypothetical protein
VVLLLGKGAILFVWFVGLSLDGHGRRG